MQRNIKHRTQRGFSLLELVVVIAILGVLVLILALGVFLPIWDLGQAAIKR